MAASFNGTSAYLARTANVPPLTATTACCWFSLNSTSPAWAQVIALGNTSGTPHGGAGASSVGGTGPIWGVNNGSAQSATGVTPAVGQAVFIAITNDGTTLRVLMRTVNQNTLSAASVTGMTGTANAIRFANSVFDGTDFAPVALWQCRAWDRILTDAELLAESFADAPVSRRDINFAWRLRTPQDLLDISGNNRPPTVTGTPTHVKHQGERQQRPKAPRRRVFGFTVGGGSTFPVTLSAAVSSSVLLQRAVSGTRAAAAAGSASTLARQAQAVRSVAGGSSATAQRALTATKVAAQASTPALVRQVQKIVAAAVGGSATLGTIKAKLDRGEKLINEVLKKDPQNKEYLAIKAKLVTLSASIGSSATVVRLVGAIRSASGAATAALNKAFSVTRSAASSSSATAARLVNAIRSAAQSSAATLSAQKVLLLTLSAGTTLAASLAKQIQATRVATAVVTLATVAKLLTKTLAVTQAEVATLFQGDVPVWPAPADVRAGVPYGPTGTEYVGTLVAGGGGSFFRRR